MYSDQELEEAWTRGEVSILMCTHNYYWNLHNVVWNYNYNYYELTRRLFLFIWFHVIDVPHIFFLPILSMCPINSHLLFLASQLRCAILRIWTYLVFPTLYVTDLPQTFALEYINLFSHNENWLDKGLVYGSLIILLGQIFLSFQNTPFAFNIMLLTS